VPTDQMSDFYEYAFLLYTYGDINNHVPHIVLFSCSSLFTFLENPKSAILIMKFSCSKFTISKNAFLYCLFILTISLVRSGK